MANRIGFQEGRAFRILNCRNNGVIDLQSTNTLECHLPSSDRTDSQSFRSIVPERGEVDCFHLASLLDENLVWDFKLREKVLIPCNKQDSTKRKAKPSQCWKSLPVSATSGENSRFYIVPVQDTEKCLKSNGLGMNIELVPLKDFERDLGAQWEIRFAEWAYREAPNPEGQQQEQVPVSRRKKKGCVIL